MRELERLERILPPMQRLHVLQSLFNRAGRIRCRRRSPGKQPGPQDAHHALEPFKQPIGALQRKPEADRLSSRLHRPTAQDPAQKGPSLPCAETIAEQAVAGTQAPRPPASTLFRTAPNPSGPDSLNAGVIDPSPDEAMASERSARPAQRAAHKHQSTQKGRDLRPAFKETIHPPSIRRRGIHLNRKRG